MERARNRDQRLVGVSIGALATRMCMETLLP
jgi:hypothetical protein